MPLSTGTKLGTYEVTSHIGSGGMGEVYQAHDSKLGRNVAIKVLPEQFARDPERLARFQREAKMLAALNHPNIAAIYGLEESGSIHYLVMELVPGETLRERVAGGHPVPVEEALTIAKQIAEALEAAHGSEKGIIHRDLKPANVKVTPEGRVKVLDFGLAKAFATDTATEDPSNSPTLSMNPTMHGVIMGTAAYMSPEQARAKPVTKATDIWAFGCVLYELLTGKQAFHGEDVTDILAAVVRAEPDWNRLPEATPPAIRTLLRRCLRKDRRQRLQDATDVRIEIEEAIAAPSGIGSTTSPALKGWRRSIPMSIAASIAAVLVIAAGILVWVLKPAPPSASQIPAHLQIDLPPGDRLSTSNLNLAVSTDGTELAYVGIHGGVSQLYVRALDAPDAKAIPGTEDAFNPFFSPDGQWVGFFAQGKMKKVPVGGGAPLTICDSGAGTGASWGPDDTVIFSGGSSTAGLSRVPAAGGQPKILTTPDLSKGEYSHRYPQILPGGKTVLFTSLNGFGWDESRIEALRLDTGERRVLIRGGHTGRLLPSGFLVYYRAGALLAVPFDLDRLEAKSNVPVTVTDGVLQNAGATGAAYAISTAGTLAYIRAAAGSRQFERRLVWVDRQGKTEPLAAPTRAYGSVVLSPDGQRVVANITSGTDELWVYDLARGALTQLASKQASSINPVWTPDGRRVAYRSNKAGIWNLYWRPADGSGAEERLITSDHSDTPDSWSPDGRVLAFQEANPTAGIDVWMLSLEGDHKPQLFLRTPFNELAAQFSPDGHWLAYESDESGGYQVYVQPYPGPGGKWQVSTDGGSKPRWNPKGRELFYSDGDKTMVVDVTTSPTFSATKPRLLYQGPIGVPSPDGQRFLAVQAVEPGLLPTQINVLLNWSEELKRRVPIGAK
jgi:eukaryotic-like serine/threonine-protein kinase